MIMCDRHKLAFDWIPDGCEKLLDGGCAWGYATDLFKYKSKFVYGCDPCLEFIEKGRKNYPNIKFEVYALENTSYPDQSFDVIVLSDVLEHVDNEKMVFNELFRILKYCGSLIITVPHKGVFSFMDTENYIWYLKKNFPRLHRCLFRIKHGKEPKDKIGYSSLHRHYNINDCKKLLENSEFKENFKIEKIFYGGLFLYPLHSNIFELLSIIFGINMATVLVRPFKKLAEWDYSINYGKFSYNLGLLVKKR